MLRPCVAVLLFALGLSCAAPSSSLAQTAPEAAAPPPPPKLEEAAPASAPAPLPAATEPAPPAPPPAVSAPPMPLAMPVPPPASPSEGAPWWLEALALVAGGMLAGGAGLIMSETARKAEARERRCSAAAALAAELDARRQAFDTVPQPPNVDAGVSFVSSVVSLANIQPAWLAAQGSLYLLPPKTAAHLAIHYAAVQRVADFVRGQSYAAGVRMLQANRIGGHPCPDAGAMTQAHVELAAAFRGTDKLVQLLRAIT